MKRYMEMERQIQEMQHEIVSLRRDIGILDGRTEDIREDLTLLQKPVDTQDEEKRLIVSKLKELLQCTRAGSGVKDLILDGQEKVVTIVYECGSKQVNVDGDSGIALIRDVTRHL